MLGEAVLRSFAGPLLLRRPAGVRRRDGVSVIREERRTLFGHLVEPSSMHLFFDRVADDVTWTVHGTHPLAGRYTDKRSFVAATFDRLGPLMRDAVALELRQVYVDGVNVVAELRGLSTTSEGMRYDNTFCWICRFDSAGPGAMIFQVDAYLDSAMVSWTVNRSKSRYAREELAVPMR